MVLSKKMEEARYILGIDVGSTSVKAAIVQRENGELIIEERVSCTETYVRNDNSNSEQNVSLVIASIDRCVRSLPSHLLNQVVGIGVCGQMHGVACWSSEDRPWRVDGRGTEKNATSADSKGVMAVLDGKMSNYYTWQDNRCTPEFLASLPQPHSHLSVHTGYGCCTLFWLTRNSPDSLQKFNRASTLADFVVAMLCDLDVPQMSPQNAASWGYFDTERNRFNQDLLLGAGFPVRLLPQVRPDNGVAGTLKQTWCGISAGTVVGVAFGDLQSYVLAVLQNENEAIANISTSAQLVFVDRNFVPSKAEKTLAKVVPYFNGEYLYEGAALNGGNAISVFVDSLADSLHLFGCNVSKDEVWRRLIEESCKTENDSQLRFEPVFWGERHCPLQRASITNITSDNFKMATLFRALCKGLVDNIHSLVPLSVLRDKGVSKIKATGTALLRNETLRFELENRYKPLPVHFVEQSTGADSSVGAARAVLKLLAFARVGCDAGAAAAQKLTR